MNLGRRILTHILGSRDSLFACFCLFLDGLVNKLTIYQEMNSIYSVPREKRRRFLPVCSLQSQKIKQDIPPRVQTLLFVTCVLIFAFSYASKASPNGAVF